MQTAICSVVLFPKTFQICLYPDLTIQCFQTPKTVCVERYLAQFPRGLQASLAVLLTISYGAVASRFNLLKESLTRDVSKLASECSSQHS
jgi:hypothetical protein